MEDQQRDQDLFELFTRTNLLLQRYQQKLKREKNRVGDPHRGQGRVLALLRLQGEISQKDLAFLLDMRTQSLGELLTKLEASGYITREPSTADRRVVMVKLTEAGREAAEEVAKNQEESDKVFSVLTNAEQAMLAELLGRVIENLENHLGEGQNKDKEKDAFDKIFEKMGFDKGKNPFTEGAEAMSDFFEAMAEKINKNDFPDIDFGDLFKKRKADEEDHDDVNEPEDVEYTSCDSDEPTGETSGQDGSEEDEPKDGGTSDPEGGIVEEDPEISEADEKQE